MLNKKLVILGNIGSGKTTIANFLGESLSIPVYHLDLLLFRHGKYIEEQEQIVKVKEIVERDMWVIDGNYSYTMDIRCSNADLIIFVNTNRWICLWRFIKRYISIKVVPSRKTNKFYGGCDIFDKKVIKLILEYDKVQSKRYKEIVRTNACCKVIEISKIKELIRVLETN